MAGQDKDTDSVRAVNRALDILMAFTAGDATLSAADLLERVSLSRPTLYRLLHTLEQSGFLVASGDPQQFRLGPCVAHLAHVWTASLDVSVLAQPMMRVLWDKTGETVALFVPQGKQRICLSELPSQQALSFKRGVGHQERLVRGASGRAILAHTPHDDKLLRQYARGIRLKLDGYPAELKLIRQRGYAVSKNELIEGAVAVAAPFFNGAGQIAGSLAVYGPGTRLKDVQIKRCGALLVQQAGVLSKALGHALS